MSISLTSFASGSICTGYTWSVEDIDELASHIAVVAVGQADHLSEILANAGIKYSTTESTTDSWAVQSALELLTASPTDPYHRDGWIFQVMSWIAAYRGSPNAIIRAPHMIKAHKGFDGIQVEIADLTFAINAVVIFEDKATENPRSVIRDDVWPDFRGLESGKEQNVLVAEVTTLLKGAGHSGAVKAVKDIIWRDNKHYRLSITIGQTHSSPEGWARLFADYEDVAPGDLARRRAETWTVDNLRPWLHDLAERAKAKIQSMGV
ncbi:hypothetical protein [Xanthomonas sacchari]|uniref:hypothetical protein n=1 Tax=Xanthomonas sacchari TaxID=56458 RepID=UPI002257EEE1|nr:hypothetical protein [Xanthomonas sacchari]MCW0389922.1 hypothetical protein [Xanthomonas sacchari]